MAVDLGKVEPTKIKKHLAKINEKFKELFIMLAFEYIEENGKKYLKLKNHKSRVEIKHFDNLKRADFDFLVSNNFKKRLFTFLRLLANKTQLTEAVIEETIKAKNENIPTIDFENETTIAYYVFAFQTIGFALGRHICDLPNAKGFGQNEMNIFNFVVSSFVFEECKELEIEKIKPALDFWLHALLKTIQKRLQMDDYDNHLRTFFENEIKPFYSE